jgi:ArsR family transcriptional regulator
MSTGGVAGRASNIERPDVHPGPVACPPTGILIAIDMLQRLEVGAMAIRTVPPIAQPQPQPGACCSPIGAERLSERGAGLLSRQFAALADPVRLRMLSVLATVPDGAVCACDLVEPIGRSQPTVSHHLKVLKRAGLVTAQRDGKNIWYAVVPAALDALREVLAMPSPQPRDAAADR